MLNKKKRIGNLSERENMIDFVYEGFNKLKPFDKLNGDNLESLYFEAEKFYISNDKPNDEWWMKLRNSKKSNPRKFCDLNFRIKNMHENWKLHGGFKYEKWKLEDKPTSPDYIRDEINCEVRMDTHDKTIDKSSSYYYLEIPYHILDSHLTSVVNQYPNCSWIINTENSTDYKIQKKFVEEIESSDEEYTLDNLINTINEYDEKYPEKYYSTIRQLEAKGQPIDYLKFHDYPTTYKWRYKFQIQQLLSTKMFGVFYPNLFNGRSEVKRKEEYPIIYEVGSHRLLCCSLAKRNLGFWMQESFFDEDNEYFHLPKYFNGKHLTIHADLKNKHLRFGISKLNRYPLDYRKKDHRVTWLRSKNENT